MQKNIRDYMKNSGNSNQSSTSGEGAGELPNNVQTKVDGYSRMSESQLMNEMTKLACQGKNDGSLTQESMQNFYNQAAPMMTEQQRNKLKALMNSLK